MNAKLPVALTIAGSDPSGGAGIQADLKTFTALSVYGQSVITSLTAQNIYEVTAIQDVPPEFVGRQIDAIHNDLGFNAVKTGMLSNKKIIGVVADRIKHYKIKNVVVDPVIISTSGSVLLNKNAIGLLKSDLIPKSLVITPNIHEAEVLTGRAIKGIKSIKQAAIELRELGCPYVLIKGGHRRDTVNSNDLLYDGRKFTEFSAKRLKSMNFHGTGCTFSAAICAGLANGSNLEDAVRAAKRYISGSLRKSLGLKKKQRRLIHYR